MPFQYILANLLVDVPQAVGAIFLDDEGEAVEWVSNQEGPPYHLKVEGAYHAVIKRRLGELVATTNLGALRSYAFVADRLTTLTEVLPHGYYLVLVARRTGPLGLARFHLRRAAAVIAAEI